MSDMSYGSLQQPGGGGLPAGSEGDILAHDASDWAALASLFPANFFKPVRAALQGFVNVGGVAPDANTARRWGLLGGNYDTTGGNSSSVTADGYFRQTESGGVSGDNGGAQGSTCLERRFNFRVFFKFALPLTSSVRFFVVVTDGTRDNVVDNDGDAQEYVGLRFSTTKSDTNFQFVHRNSTQTVVDTGVAVDAAVHYLLVEVDDDTPSARLRLFDNAMTQEATTEATTELPDTDTAMKWVIACETQEAVAKQIRNYGIAGIEWINF